MNDLRTFQLTVAKALVGLGFVHVPMLAVISVLLGRDAAASVVVALALALAPAALLYAQRSLTTVAFGITIALVGQTSLLVLLFEGHPWQVEMHFYYFVVLAMLSGFCDWRVLVLAAGLVSLHHLTLNFLLPAAVYPGGSDLLRVAVHALFVVIEVTMLTFIGQTIRRAFFAADQARRGAEETAVELENIGSRREQYLIATSRRVEVVGGLLDKFKSEMTKSIDVLSGAVSELETSANSLSDSADSANTQAAAASSASEETTAKVTTVAEAGMELAQTISAISATVTQSSRLTSETVSTADTAHRAITELTSAAAEIGDMTGLINRIAAQTNLLALNATIEAARAGAAGRGFAIVAQEVKALAAETAKATQDIAEKTAWIQTTTERSAGAIQAILSKVQELDLLSARIAAAIEQQAAATREIAHNVDAAAAGVGNVAASIGGIEAMADLTSQATGALRRSTLELSVQTSAIRERIMSFTDEILAAQA